MCKGERREEKEAGEDGEATVVVERVRGRGRNEWYAGENAVVLCTSPVLTGDRVNR